MADNSPEPETLEQMQARHRKEVKDLQGRITSKKKNATKKTRKGVNDECADMERQMKERQAAELQELHGGDDEHDEGEDNEPTTTAAISDGVDGAAEKLEKMDIAAKPPQQPVSETQDTNNGGGGKKRNRQKERLARRAAEQEAAAIAAEEEASNMTDHRAVEKTYMLAEFAKHGLEEHEIRPDGHCLFSAVADQLSAQGIALGGGEAAAAGEPGYKTVRRRAAEYIGAHGDAYAGFLEEDLGSYVRKIRDTAEWGGQIELAALANVYGVEVAVVQDRDTEVVKPTEEGKEEEERKRIWLAYYRHGYGLGEHYNSLRKKA